jgi:hypothetical protein
MAPAADPKLYTILERVRTDLAAIVAGADYYYTPHAVRIVRAWPDDGAPVWDETLGTDAKTDPATIYFVKRELRHIERDSTGDSTTGDHPTATVELSIMVCRRNPESDTTSEALVLERMLADVHRKLGFEDPGLGGLVDGDDVYPADDAIVEDAPGNWSCAQVTLRVAYEYAAVRP